MKAKINCVTSLLVALVFLLPAGLAALAQTTDQSELEALKAAMKEMQKNLDAMQQKINELEKEKAAAPAPATNAPAGTNAAPGVVFGAPRAPIVGHASQIAPRENMNDQQEAAPRPGDQTLDPQYRGFFPIPNTPAIIMFNAKPRLDMMSDNRNSGNADRFVTATIPIGAPNAGGGEQFNMTAKGSSLSVDVRAPDMPGNFRFYYNNDFFGSGSGMAYRLKQMYGDFYNVTVGFTYSIFEDPDVWPDTVDFEGPNSMIFARQPTLRYMLPLADKWYLNFGVQQPASDIDNTGVQSAATPNNQAPDGGFNIRWEDSKWGHVQLASIFRDIGAKNTTGGDQNVLGWGLNLSGSINVWERDSVQAQLTYGQGIFHFCNDNFTYSGFNGGDAAFNNAGNLRALAYLAPMAGYTHHWSDKFRSTLTTGYVNLQNEQAQSPAAYHETYYESVNLVWQLRKRLSVGLEGLYGYKNDNSGGHGDVWRLQTGLVYTLF